MLNKRRLPNVVAFRIVTMTCTLAYIANGTIYMITDSASSDDEGGLVIRKGNTKSWIVELSNGQSILLGFAGNFSECTFLRHVFKWPRMKRSSIVKYLTKDVAKAIHVQLKDYMEGASHDWNLLVGFHDRDGPHVVVVYQNGDLEESNLQFAAIGSGAAYSIGCLDGLSRLHGPYMSIEDRLRIAMKTAQSHTTNVREPFHTLVLRT
jgi:ATP-dependent protease HslVU (ClpYQ) peptidase subunit